MIQQVWKKTNISTLLILPIFDDIIVGTRTKSEPKLGFPFVLLAYEYGLENAYLFRGTDFSKRNLYLVFSKKVLHNLNLTDSGYYSLNERLLDYDGCTDVEITDKKVIYTLKIPAKYTKDIKLIIKGRYSKVSLTYKEMLRIKYKRIPRWDNKIANYIVKVNMAHAIVTKQLHLKEDMKAAIGQDFDNSQEFYDGFKKERELILS